PAAGAGGVPGGGAAGAGGWPGAGAVGMPWAGAAVAGDLPWAGDCAATGAGGGPVGWGPPRPAAPGGATGVGDGGVSGVLGNF
ncbi:MAG: hypothetical protein LBR80_12230, partial [Deltaproteobacteria bacterium]|nr:hypothetical protein [Deltaproteobacteria bacterium]